ncbi:MAG: hypothetical protein M1833_004172 [Piccolia ochrophora]|nr:MAG: hypothetical protein M1833_004172 [Piccolia ochrophora]
MTVSHDYTVKTPSNGSSIPTCLEDKFEVLKHDIGDGSFGSVALARVRSAGAHVARRGTLVAIKTMKKTFDSFTPCLELREVIFLRSLPVHAHLVPALDIFLDPFSKKLHICMEHMDGNLYQLMKARDHKVMDAASVKSILFQILSGLEHIHAHSFFHRDIKPENILVSTSAPQDMGIGFRRYSTLVTPPATPPVYTVKIADFGLARETHSKLPYTTYVSTRWYRAPEVLLRAGEYSAPVDIWAIGAMAVEVATLKPLFPGSNEVDQVWRVCEIMGSPGNWYNKSGVKVGGGDWREGMRLAQKLGFSFPKMAPHSIDTILQAPQWPASLSSVITWCLLWDPRHRPTATQVLNHEYFRDAVDPLRPKSSASRHLGRKQSDLSYKSGKDAVEVQPVLTSKPSWFRKSLIGRDSSQNIGQQASDTGAMSPRPTPMHVPIEHPTPKPQKSRLFADKRATWTHGLSASNAAPMPILPSIRPISPLSDAVTAQANSRRHKDQLPKETDGDKRRRSMIDDKAAKKIGRQLSAASSSNHYAELHRQEAERALNGSAVPVASPTAQKESFFSHLRKRARRLSGRHQLPLSPTSTDIESVAGCGPWSSNRSSMALDASFPAAVVSSNHGDFKDLDKALQNVRGSVETSSPVNMEPGTGSSRTKGGVISATGPPKRQPPMRQDLQSPTADSSSASAHGVGPVSSRTRRAMQMSSHPVHRYETPDEEEELLDEIINSTNHAMARMAQTPILEKGTRRQGGTLEEQHRTPNQSSSVMHLPSYNPYPTPSPSANRNSVTFGRKGTTSSKRSPIDIRKNVPDENAPPMKWPTPPYEENEWAASAAASIYAAGAAFQ